MSGHKRHDDGAFDLLALARRGELASSDERRLRDLLATSAEARALYDAGRAFDREASVMAGDDERIERLVDQVQARLGAPTAASRRKLVVRACLTAALVATSAVGANA